MRTVSEETSQAGAPPAAAAAVGPAFDALARARAAVADLRDALEGVAASDLAELTEQVHTLGTMVTDAHLRSLGLTMAAAALPPGPIGVRAWLRHTHRVPRREAGRLAAAAAWLGEHPAVAERLAAGELLLEHADAMRRVSQRTPRRREAFAEFEGLLIEAARHADADRFAQIMAAWGDAVDAQGADDDADAAHGRRRVHLAPVADGWDLRGWLPAALGAELAGILNEYLSRSRRDEPDAAARTPAAARRADALLDLTRAAAAADLPAAARDRAKIVITLPAPRLAGTERPPGPPPTGKPGAALPAPTLAGLLAWLDAAACTWATGNGPGTGALAHTEALWLSCDADITRLVSAPDSQPLDVGRTTRTIPPWLRTALNHRDHGCIIPGCDRPPAWCEAHHITHWADGGHTSLPNLALLCSRHHHELHHGHWHITPTPTGPHATRRE